MDYLMRLAALALAFVGFSAIVVTLRRALGGELSGLHLHLVRLFIEGGMAVTACALLPPVLNVAGLPDDLVWRLSSVVAGSTFAAYLLSLGRRRRRVEVGPFSWRVVGRFVFSSLATAALWMNATGVLWTPGVGVYAVALTWFLVMGGLVFLQNLESFIQPDR